MPEENKAKKFIRAEDVPVFEMAKEKLIVFHREIEKLSSKKPDNALNKFKLGFINQVLGPLNNIIGEDYRPFPDFTLFDVDGSFPTTSDALMMLSQYITAIGNFSEDHRISIPMPRYLGDTTRKSVWNTGEYSIEDECDETDDPEDLNG